MFIKLNQHCEGRILLDVYNIAMVEEKNIYPGQPGYVVITSNVNNEIRKVVVDNNFEDVCDAMDKAMR